MKDDFDIESCLTSESKEIPRQNYVAFISLKDKIYAASTRYSIRQIWAVLHAKGKYKGSYNTFAYYFKKFKQAQTNEVITEQMNTKESKEDAVQGGSLSNSNPNVKKPFSFDIPTDGEEEL